MQELVEFIVDNITGKKSEVELIKEESRSVILIKVPQEKIGQVVGKRGQVIKAIRILVGIKAANENLPGYWRVEVQ